MFSYMKVYCPICRIEMDGMRTYGESNTCGRDCHREWGWRRALAICNESYRPDQTHIEFHDARLDVRQS